MCNWVDLMNRLTLCPCKLTWVKIKLQKIITLYINPYNKQKTTVILNLKKNYMYCVTMVRKFQNSVEH